MIQIDENRKFIIKGVPTIIYKIVDGNVFGKHCQSQRWSRMCPKALKRFYSGEYEIEYCSEGCGGNTETEKENSPAIFDCK